MTTSFFLACLIIALLVYVIISNSPAVDVVYRSFVAADVEEKRHSLAEHGIRTYAKNVTGTPFPGRPFEVTLHVVDPGQRERALELLREEAAARPPESESSDR